MKTLDEVTSAIGRHIAGTDGERSTALGRAYRRRLDEAFFAGGLRVHSSSDLLPIKPTAPWAAVQLAVDGVVHLAEINRWFADEGIAVQLTERSFELPRKERRLQDTEVRAAAFRHANDVARERPGHPSARSIVGAVTIRLNAEFDTSFEAESVRKYALHGWIYRVEISEML